MTDRTFTGSQRNGRLVFWLVYGATMLIAIVNGPAISLPLTEIGNDDAMRLVEVRDLLAGQSWFDLTQYRLGFEGGTLMHWSRLVDLPIATVLAGFSVIFAQDMAELLTMVHWPFALMGLTLWLVGRAAAYYGGELAGWFGLLFAAVAITNTRKYEIGALDHHNVQMVLMSVILLMLMRSELSYRHGVYIGLAGAVSLSVGLEILPFMATVSALLAGLWAWKPAVYRQGAIGFSGAFAISLLGLFWLLQPDFADIPFKCDAFGPELIRIGVTGALGLVAAVILSTNKSTFMRVLLVGVVAIIVVVVAVLFAPQCLENPYAPIHPDVVQHWLTDIQETKSIAHVLSTGNLANWAFVVIPFIALLAAIRGLNSRDQAARAVILLACLLGAYGLIFYQIRGLFFLFLLCAIPLSDLSSRLYKRYRADKTLVSGVAFIIVLFTLFPVTWSIASVALHRNPPASAAGPVRATISECYHPEALHDLGQLPEGVVAGSIDLGVRILLLTDHRTLAANFHRNHDGIQAIVGLMTADLNESERILREHGVTYVVFCETDSRTISLSKNHPENIWSALYSGNLPDYLMASDTGEGRLRVYTLKPEPET